MGISLFGIGTTALNAAQAGLIATEHNISNANTPGFHRQQIVQSSPTPLLTGSGYFGQGTSVDTVKRIYSQFLDNQVMQSEGNAGYLDAYYSQVRQIDNLLADPNAGLSPALRDFFNSVQTLSADPASVTARQALLSGASTLTGRFDSLQEQLQGLRSGVNSQITSMVGEINAYASQIADLNQQISLARSASASSTQDPNDMMDHRDELIAELNKLVQVSVVKQDDGSYNLFIGSGQALIVGSRTFNLTAAQSKEDPDNLVVAYASSSSSSTPLSDSSLSGGSLGGILSFRSGILDSAFNALGRVAVGLAQSFNAQHALGVDLDGNLGGNFFNLASGTSWVQANSNNTGSATLATTYNGNVGALTTDNYRISYNGTTYSLTNLSSSTTTSGLNATQLTTSLAGLGLTLSISGTAAAGDKWLVLPTRYGASGISTAISNTAQIAAAAPVLASATLANTGTGEITAGAVNSTFTALAAAVTLTYDSSTGEFSASPAQAITVTSGGTTTSYASGVAFPYTSGATISFGGISFQITGTPANTDSFVISPNYGASFTALSDNRNTLLLGQLQKSNQLANNSSGVATATFSAAYNQIVSEVGNKTREFEVRSKAQTSVVAQARQEQQSLSGVNLDEEAANLLRYQQAYQAAGKAMQIASTLFDTLLGLGR